MQYGKPVPWVTRGVPVIVQHAPTGFNRTDGIQDALRADGVDAAPVSRALSAGTGRGRGCKKARPLAGRADEESRVGQF